VNSEFQGTQTLHVSNTGIETNKIHAYDLDCTNRKSANISGDPLNGRQQALGIGISAPDYNNYELITNRQSNYSSLPNSLHADEYSCVMTACRDFAELQPMYSNMAYANPAYSKYFF
jgi:hypothetical protein